MAGEEAVKKAVRLSEDEKQNLISFYEINKVLWSSDIKYKDKEEKNALRTELENLFDQKYSADFLEKNFHNLRTAFTREYRKIAAGQEPKRIWRFYQQLEFLKEEIDRPKKPNFDIDERETLIDFFKLHPSLWNHNMPDYRDRDLRDSLLGKLVAEFDGKFKKEDIKQEWHSLQVSYKREKSREEGSRTSGVGVTEVYYSPWEHYNQMEFLDDSANVDDSYTSLHSEPFVPPSKKKKTEKENEKKAKMELWQSLTKSLNAKRPEESDASNPDNVHKERAHLFGKVVADSLLQYEGKEWVYLKKKIMDVFYDYDQQKPMELVYPQGRNPPGPNYFQNLINSNYMQANQHEMFRPFSPSPSPSNSTDS